MTKKRILIIDDEQQVISALQKKLGEEGFDVLTASDGKEGLEKALKDNPDLILLDLILPIIDGVTLLDKLKTDDNVKEIPVIILTNLDDSDKVDECRKKGVYDYLVKINWTLEDISKKVKSVFGEN